MSRRTRGKVSQNDARAQKKQTKSVKVRVNLRLCPQPEGPGNREAGPWKPCQNPEVSHYTPVQHSGSLLFNAILSHILYSHSLSRCPCLLVVGDNSPAVDAVVSSRTPRMFILPSAGGVSHPNNKSKNTKSTITQEGKLLASVRNGLWL